MAETGVGAIVVGIMAEVILGISLSPCYLSRECRRCSLG